MPPTALRIQSSLTAQLVRGGLPDQHTVSGLHCSNERAQLL